MAVYLWSPPASDTPTYRPAPQPVTLLHETFHNDPEVETGWNARVGGPGG